MSPREAGELTQALKDLKEEVVLLRSTVTDLDKRFVTRMEFRVVGGLLSLATAVIGIISTIRGH